MPKPEDSCSTHDRCIHVQGLLQHTVIKHADQLEGMYKQAFDRIINQVRLSMLCTAQLLPLDICWQTTQPAVACQALHVLDSHLSAMSIC